MGPGVLVGALTSAVRSLVECRDQYVASGVFARGLNQSKIQPGSVQGLICGLRSICRGLEQRQDTAWFRAGTKMWVQEYSLRDGTGLDTIFFSARTKMWAQECWSQT